MRRLLLGVAVLTGIAGCAPRDQLVMLNPRTGALVGCERPDPYATSGEFLASDARACISACHAHGFVPVPQIKAQGAASATPAPCAD